MNKHDRRKLKRLVIELDTEEEQKTKRRFLIRAKKNETTGKNILLDYMRNYK